MERIPPRIKLKPFWQLSAAQIVLTMGLGGGLLLVLSLDWPPEIKILLALIDVALVMVVLFLELQGAPFHAWAASAIRYWMRYHYYVWRRSPIEPAATTRITIALTSRPNFFRRAWQFASPHVGVGLAVAIALVGIFLLAQLVSFAFRFDRAVSAAFANVTPWATWMPQPTTVATPTPMFATPIPLATPSPHAPLRVITGWQCPIVSPEQGVNTHLYLSAFDRPAQVEIRASYADGEESRVTFQIPAGQTAAAVVAPSFVPLSAIDIRSDVSLAAECRVAYWNRMPGARAGDMATIWWFPRSAWPGGVRVWFFQVVSPTNTRVAIRLSVMQGERILAQDPGEERSGKLFPRSSTQTKATEPGTGYLLQSETAFAVSSVWH